MLIALAFFAALWTALSGLDAAAQYPDKPIRLLVPIAPGGGPDVIARVIAPKLSAALGQPVIVENRVGANGNIAGETVVKSPPDGYVLLLGMDSLLAVNPHLYANMPFDSLKDLVPVASLISSGFIMTVNPSVPAQTFPEFMEYARRSNPPLLYGSGGNGSQSHLTMERLKARTGVNMVHVPYKSGVAASTATVAGEVSAMMSGTATTGLIRAGRLRALAFTGPRRSILMPDVPTIAEFYPDLTMVQWSGVFAPAGTPEPVLSRLRAEVNKALALPDVKERLRNAGGMEPWITTPDEFAAEIRSDHAKYAKLLKEVGVKID